MLFNGYKYFDSGSPYVYPFVKAFLGVNLLDVAYDGNIIGEVQVVEKTVVMAGVGAETSIPLSKKFSISIDAGYAAIDAFNSGSVAHIEGAIYTAGLSYSF